MQKKSNHKGHYTPIQLKIPVNLEKIIEISDPIYTFNEIMERIDLQNILLGKTAKWVAQDLILLSY